MRSREIIQQEANGGSNCPPLWEAECCDDSNRECSPTTTPPPLTLVFSTTSTTTTLDCTTCGLCFAFGDPHFIGFDGAEAMFRETMNFWLVHSDKVHIQGMSISKYGMQRGIAIGGPFLKGHNLVAFLEGKADVSALGNAFPIKVAWDGKEVLTKDGDVVKQQGICELHRYPPQTMLLDDEETDKLDGNHQWWHKDFKNRWKTSVHSVYRFKCAENVEIFLASHQNLEVIIKMPKQEGQAGYCGNFNGNPRDDSKQSEGSYAKAIGEMLEAPKESEDLFKAFGKIDDLEFKPNWKTSSMIQPLAPETCPEELKAKAEHFCHQIPEKSLHTGCVYDICTTNQTSASIAAFIMEIMKVKFGKNMVKFDGTGRCLDQDGKPFSSLTAQKDVPTADACIALVAKSVGVKGLQGAQVKKGSSIECQILMDPNTKVEAELPEVWGSRQESQGKGIVSSGSGEEDWDCWMII